MTGAMHVVFLQGMPSFFFTQVAMELTGQGIKATGINLCVGDQLFWRGACTVNFRGRHADWPSFIAAFFARENVTDLVLLGEQRDYHKQAIEVAHQHHVRVSVVDFGYLRPDWIALERDGMNGNSLFPRDTGAITRLAAGSPKADLTPRYKDSTFNMASGDLLYSFSNVLLGWLFPHYRRSDKRPHPLVYFPSIGLRLLLAGVRHRKASAKMASVYAGGQRYFLFPLQLEHDFQIVAYSSITLEEALRKVIASLAHHADAGTRLVIKCHPWDPGLKNWKKRIAGFAAACGALDRVDYIDGGNLDEIINASEGMITVNSTAGIRALQLGKPVLTLADAVYGASGLISTETLDNFWKKNTPPDPALVDSFVNALAASVLVRGVFFSEPGLSAGAKAVAGHIRSRTVGALLMQSEGQVKESA